MYYTYVHTVYNLNKFFVIDSYPRIIQFDTRVELYIYPIGLFHAALPFHFANTPTVAFLLPHVCTKTIVNSEHFCFLSGTSGSPLLFSLSLLSISLSPPFTIVYIYYFSFSQSIFGRYSIQPFNPSISLFVYLIFYFKLFYYITFYLPSREKKSYYEWSHTWNRDLLLYTPLWLISIHISIHITGTKTKSSNKQNTHARFLVLFLFKLLFIIYVVVCFFFFFI